MVERVNPLQDCPCCAFRIEEDRLNNDPVWQHVELYKKGLEEAPRLEIAGNEIEGRVEKEVNLENKRHGKLADDRFKWRFVQDLRTGDLYIDDDRAVVSTKCFLILIGTPFYVPIYLGWNCFKRALTIVNLASDAIQTCGNLWAEEEKSEAVLTVVKTFLWEIPKELGLGIWNIVRAPFYAIGVMFSALYGVLINPYEGRKFEAMVEYAWQHEVSHLDSVAHVVVPRGENNCTYSIAHSSAIYLAFCFQVRNNINEPLSDENHNPRFAPFEEPAVNVLEA